MKKKTNLTKISLNKETVAILSGAQLALVGGGDPIQTDTTSRESIVYDCPSNPSRCERSCFSSCNLG